MSKVVDKLKRKKKKKKKFKAFLVTLTILMVTLISGGVYVYSTLNKMTAKDPTLIKDKGSYEEFDKGGALSILPSKPSKPTNILILGADYVEGESTDFTKRRTDTMIIAHYDPINEKLTGVSVPRDTQVKVNNRIQKLNAVNEIGGPKLLIKTLKELIDIDINYYVIIDYSGFNKIIDAIGGVDVTVQQRMKYDDAAQNYHIDYQKGQQVHLDGKGAETFFRWRKNNSGITTDTIDAGGDLGRIENQRVLIRSIIDKVSKPTIIPKIPSLLDKVTESVITDMSPTEMLKYGVAFATIGNDNIEFLTLKGEAENTNAWYYMLDQKKNIDLINTLNYNVPYFDRSELKINIINESNSSTAATNVKQYLVNNSPYTGNNITNTKMKTTIAQSYVEIYDIDKIYNDVMINDFKNFNIKKVENKTGKNQYDVIVHIGKDYKYTK